MEIEFYDRKFRDDIELQSEILYAIKFHIFGIDIAHFTSIQNRDAFPSRQIRKTDALDICIVKKAHKLSEMSF